MNDKTCQHQENVIAYMTGELTAEERLEFLRHVDSCTLCQKELKNLKEVWDVLPFTMEEAKLPQDLKSEVIDTVTGETKKHITTPAVKLNQFRKWTFITAACTLLIISWLVWDNIQLRHELTRIQESTLSKPTEVTETIPLRAANSETEAYGTAYIADDGEKRRILLQLNNLPPTTGEEAYQVWLIQNGKRHNAGTFRVDQQGSGILTHVIEDPRLSFDSIGITLEPDPYGTQPRGPKIVGS